MAAKLLTKDEAWRIAANVAKLRAARSRRGSIEIKYISGDKGDDNSGETEPKHITDILSGHTLPSFHFGQHSPLFGRHLIWRGHGKFSASHRHNICERQLVLTLVHRPVIASDRPGLAEDLLHHVEILIKHRTGYIAS
jgi:hypothetical protein